MKTVWRKQILVQRERASHLDTSWDKSNSGFIIIMFTNWCISSWKKRQTLLKLMWLVAYRAMTALAWIIHADEVIFDRRKVEVCWRRCKSRQQSGWRKCVARDILVGRVDFWRMAQSGVGWIFRLARLATTSTCKNSLGKDLVNGNVTFRLKLFRYRSFENVECYDVWLWCRHGLSDLLDFRRRFRDEAQGWSQKVLWSQGERG